MMKYDGNERLKDRSKCAVLRANLKMCVLESECCKVVSVNITYNLQLRDNF